MLMLGRGGHAAVVEDAFAGVVDGWVLADGEELGVAEFSESQVIRSAERPVLLNGLGYVGGSNYRRAVFEKFQAAGFDFETIVHESALLGSGVDLDTGAQVLLGSRLNVGALVGKNTIVNTGAIVEHHVVVGHHCHVAPNATICGDAVVGEGSFVGAGAVVIHGVEVAAGTTVGAGAVVTKAFDEGAVLVGSPARPVIR